MELRSSGINLLQAWLDSGSQTMSLEPRVSVLPSEWLLSKSLQTINAGEGAEKREPSYTVGRNAN